MSKRRDKGTGTIRKRSDGRWEGRYTDSSGEPKYIYRETKSAVREALKEIEYIQNIKFFDNIGGDVSFKVWFEHYIEIKSLSIKQRSINQIKLAYHNHIEPIIGNKMVYMITQNDILAIQKSLKKKGLSDCTIDNINTHLKAMINFALKERIIDRNPWFPIKSSRKPKKERRDLTPAEIDLILQMAWKQDMKIYLMLYIMISTGIRVGELCGIKWQDFTNNFRQLHINESRTDNVFENSLKSEASERNISINKNLALMLQDYYKNNQNEQYGGHVFVNRNKRLYTDLTVGKRLHYITDCIYETQGIDLRFVTPHYFRHTYATVGLNNGIAAHDMRELMGHKKLDTTMRYAHSNTTRKNNAAEEIANHIFSEHKNPILSSEK